MLSVRPQALPALFCAALLAAAPAAAQLAATPLEPGGFYVGAGADAVYFHVPKVDGVGVTMGANWALGTETDLWGWGIDGTLGYVLPKEHALFGENMRIEASGGYAAADAESVTPFSGPVTLSFEGPNLCCSAQTSGGTQLVSRSIEVKHYDAQLLVLTDFGDDSLRLSPFAGFVYLGLSQEHRFTITNGWFLQDRVDTDYLGGSLGLETAMPLGGGVVFSLTARADLLNADADMRSSTPFFIGANTTQRDDANEFAARLGGNLSLSRQFGPVVVALEGFGSWLSYAPQLVLPFVFAPFQPAHLESDDMWTAGGGLRMTIPF